MVGKICDDLSEEVHFSWILRRKKKQDSVEGIFRKFSAGNKIISRAHRGRG